MEGRKDRGTEGRAQRSRCEVEAELLMKFGITSRRRSPPPRHRWIYVMLT